MSFEELIRGIYSKPRREDLLEKIVGRVLQYNNEQPYTIVKAVDRDRLERNRVTYHYPVITDDMGVEREMEYKQLDTLLERGFLKIPTSGFDCNFIRIIGEEFPDEGRE